MMDDAVKLLESIGNCLNNQDHEKADYLLSLFDQKFSKQGLPQFIIFNRLALEAELAKRTGKTDETLNFIVRNLHIFDSVPAMKVELLLRAGQLECISNRIGISPKYFTEALGIAEEIGDEDLIAKVYQYISKMFAFRFQGLAIYFIRKAELIFSKCSKPKEAFICKMERALLYSVAPTIKNNDKFKVLLDEAKNIVNLPFVDNLTPFEKRHCLYIKAFVDRDESVLINLIKELDAVDALPDRCRYKEMYLGICIEKGLWKSAEDMFDSYKEDLIRRYKGIQDIDTHLSNTAQIIRNRNSAIYIPHHFVRKAEEPITLFDNLDHYSLEDEIWSLDKSIFRSLFPSYEQEGKFEIIEMPDGSSRLYPLGLAFNVYYRGQSQPYPKSFPSLYRDGVSEAEAFVARMRYEELKRCINDYPITDLFRNDFCVQTPDGLIPVQLSVDELALAQHYGIPTELMDLTADKFVAAFFATTTWNGKDYSPILDKREKPGAFYRYSETLPNYEILSAVGLQPFSRPGEQCGLVYRLKKGEDFNKIVWSEDLFEHDPIVSEFIFNYSNRSKKLFPESPLTKHAEEITKSRKLSKWAYDEAKKEFYPDVPDDILKLYLKDQNIELEDNISFTFSEEEKQQCLKEWENGGREQTNAKILVRLTYNNPISFSEEDNPQPMLGWGVPPHDDNFTTLQLQNFTTLQLQNFTTSKLYNQQPTTNNREAVASPPPYCEPCSPILCRRQRYCAPGADTLRPAASL